MSAGTIKSICQLTDREVEVAEYYSQGLTEEGVGLALGISGKTVHYHLTNFYRKTKTVGAAMLTRWVIANLETKTKPTAFFKV
jgi:DNA-binding CsgD family transcriptional regulator